MATPVTYPKISRKLWWLVRDRLKKSVPSEITSTYILSIAPMADASARSNVISPLRDLGILDENNRPTDLARRWRHDDDYPAVCAEIRQLVYPNVLLESFPDADLTQKDSIKNWFMKVGHVGEAAAKMYADTYILLSQADPARIEEKPATIPSPKRAPRTTSSLNAGRISGSSSAVVAAPIVAVESPAPHHRRIPAIHIDVQVHISPDTSAEQIDRIFESMAKHLGNFTQ